MMTDAMRERAPDAGPVATVAVEARGGIGRLELRNPRRRNAITQSMWRELAQGAHDFANDAGLRAVVLRGEGDVAFTSGADISEFGESRRSEAQADAYTDAVQAAIAALEAIPVPVVGLVHGFCMGGGMAVVMACDMRFVDDTSRFGIPAARLGIGYSPVWIKRLVDVVGPAFASEILMTGRTFGAHKALASGLANEVLPAATLDDAVEETLQTLAANAPLSMRAAKSAIRESLAFERDRDWTTPFELARVCSRSQDYQDALEAFAERRTPVFHGV